MKKNILQVSSLVIIFLILLSSCVISSPTSNVVADNVKIDSFQCEQDKDCFTVLFCMGGKPARCINDVCQCVPGAANIKN
ncbi:hypothetical protein LINPERHAP1_LOCUS40836 [Linum perenne]